MEKVLWIYHEYLVLLIQVIELLQVCLKKNNKELSLLSKNGHVGLETWIHTWESYWASYRWSQLHRLGIWKIRWWWIGLSILWRRIFFNVLWRRLYPLAFNYCRMAKELWGLLPHIYIRRTMPGSSNWQRRWDDLNKKIYPWRLLDSEGCGMTLYCPLRQCCAKDQKRPN